VPSPTGGTFSVEVNLQPRWCGLAIDRWRTTDRAEEPSRAWFKENVWPAVMNCGKRTGYGHMPSGGGAYAGAYPIDRSALLDVLTAWVDQELTWGVPRESERVP
jgi:hypothetical protein